MNTQLPLVQHSGIDLVLSLATVQFKISYCSGFYFTNTLWCFRWILSSFWRMASGRSWWKGWLMLCTKGWSSTPRLRSDIRSTAYFYVYILQFIIYLERKFVENWVGVKSNHWIINRTGDVSAGRRTKAITLRILTRTFYWLIIMYLQSFELMCISSCSGRIKDNSCEKLKIQNNTISHSLSPVSWCPSWRTWRQLWMDSTGRLSTSKTTWAFMALKSGRRKCRASSTTMWNRNATASSGPRSGIKTLACC